MQPACLMVILVVILSTSRAIGFDSPNNKSQALEEEKTLVRKDLEHVPDGELRAHVIELIAKSNLEARKDLNTCELNLTTASNSSAHYAVLASLTLNRDIEEDFRKQFLGKCVRADLMYKPKEVVEDAIRALLEKRCAPNESGKVWSTLLTVSDVLMKSIKERGWTVEEFLKYRANAKNAANEVLHRFRKYCLHNLGKSECASLVFAAKQINPGIQHIFSELHETYLNVTDAET